MAQESNQKPAPKLVKLNKALKLAEAWVNGMSGSATGEPKEVEFEGRPSRLGLGAKVAPITKGAASVDPVERKLLGKVNAAKRRSMEDSRKGNNAEEGESSGDDGDEPESRTNAFAKKRAMPLVTTPQSKKKR